MSEDDLEKIIEELQVNRCLLSYSDLSHDTVRGVRVWGYDVCVCVGCVCIWACGVRGVRGVRACVGMLFTCFSYFGV